MKITLGKILSLVVAVSYVAALMFYEHGMSVIVIRVFISILFPLGFIWFPDQFGNYTGYFGRGNYIDTKTPSIIVSILGWFFLAGFPLLIFLCMRYG